MKNINEKKKKQFRLNMMDLLERLPEDIREHSRRTACAAAFFFPYIRQNLLYEEEELCYTQEQIRMAVLYHEIGCLVVPEENEKHTIYGGLILNDYRHRRNYPKKEEIVWRAAAEAAVGHHERWDGTGYPYRQIATAVPMIARITAIVDYFDEGTVLEGSIEEGRFDPRLLRRFWEIYFEKEELRKIFERPACL